MVFVNPTSDIAFKKLFGDPEHKIVVVSFLNNVLGRKNGNTIVDVFIGNPQNLPATETSKWSIVDIRCKDESGTEYIIEIQVANEYNYAQRSLYYSAVALSTQLKAASAYTDLTPVIFIGVLGFNFLESQDYISHHFILDKKTGEHKLKHLEFHFIELPKFNKTLEEANDVLDMWLYILKNAASLDQVPDTLKKYPEFKEAFNILSRASWSKKDLDNYIDALNAQLASQGVLKAATIEGEKIGMEIGMKQGIEKGIEKGKIEIARNLLQEAKMDIQGIAHITGLSVTQVQKIKDEQ